MLSGDYAFYIWGAYGMTFALLIIESVQLWRRYRATLRQVAHLSRMRQGAKDESTP